MAGLLATMGGEAAGKISEVGFQLVLMACLALTLGAFRLLAAARTPGRWFLAGGSLLLAAGVTLLVMEWYGFYEMGYYPEWKDDILDTDMTDEEVLEADPYYYSGPAWWEPVVWWGQRVCRLAGLGFAALGFFLEGRVLLGAKKKRTR